MNKIIFLFLLSLTSISSHAGFLDGVITSGADSFKKFHSNKGTTISAGSTRIRVPHSSYKLVSISPPSISGGCNGIDINLGGFSFISKDEALNMLRQIAQGAVSQAFFLAFTQACPACAAALKKVEEMARWANKFAVDTCHISTMLAEKGMEAISDKQSSKCSSSTSNQNTNSSFLAAFSATDGACKDEVLKELKKCRSGMSAAECEAQKRADADIVGVSTFRLLEALNAFDPSKEEGMEYINLVINVFGTKVNGVSTNFKPLSSGDFNTLLVCGVEAPSTPTISHPRFNCPSFYERADKMTIMTCEKGKTSECDTIEQKTTLKDFVSNAKHLSQLGITQNGIFNSFYEVLVHVSKELKKPNPQALTNAQAQLLSAAPFDIFRLLNLSAHYGDDLVFTLLGDSLNEISEDIARATYKELFENRLSSIGAAFKALGEDDTVPSLPDEVFDTYYTGVQDEYKLGHIKATQKQQKMAFYDDISAKINHLEKSLLRTNAPAIIKESTR